MNLKEIVNRVNIPVNLHEAYKKAGDIRSKERVHSGNKEFREYYGDEVVNGDLARVKEREEAFEKSATTEEKEAKKLATVAEVIMYQQSELSNWFGEGARTIEASDFDDWENGADFIIEFEGRHREGEVPKFNYLVIDVTLSQDIEKKLRGIKTGLHNHEINKIKYFHTAYDEYKSNNDVKRLDCVPRAIISLNIETFSELMNLWLDKRSDANKLLAENKVQLIILTELLDQVEKFQEYAEREDADRVRQDNAEIIVKYKAIRDLLLDAFARKVIEFEERGGSLPNLDMYAPYKVMKRYLEEEFLKKNRF